MGTSKEDPFGFLRTVMIIALPQIAKVLNIPFINVEATDFIVNIIRYQNLFFDQGVSNNYFICPMTKQKSISFDFLHFRTHNRNEAPHSLIWKNLYCLMWVDSKNCDDVMTTWFLVAVKYALIMFIIVFLDIFTITCYIAVPSTHVYAIPSPYSSQSRHT